MILSDKEIEKLLEEKQIDVSPLDINLVGPSGLDMRLGYQMRVFKEDSDVEHLNPFDPASEHATELVEPEDGRFIIEPGQVVLASTLERIELPEHLVARLESRSSLTRLGLVILGTSGSVEPGFRGHLTIPIINTGKLPILMYPEMCFCKLAFETMSTKAATPYYARESSKYVDQKGPVASRLHMEKKE